MKTNDLTRSKGWDQGWKILRPSQFPTWEINEAREQPFLCIFYSLRPLSPVAVVCSPPVGLSRPYESQWTSLLIDDCNCSILYTTQAAAHCVIKALASLILCQFVSNFQYKVIVVTVLSMFHLHKGINVLTWHLICDALPLKKTKQELFFTWADMENPSSLSHVINEQAF